MAGDRQTENIDLGELQTIVPGYTRERELEMWDRNGPSGDALAARPTEQPDLVVRYAEHEDGIIDVFLPADQGVATAMRKLVFVVHGGAYRQEWDRTYLRHFARLLNGRGAVVALPEYRRTGGLGGWPATAYDVEAALVRVPDGINAMAPGYVDPTQGVVVVGHSAGAHLGPWAALRAGRSKVSKIIAIAPSFDLVFKSRTRHMRNSVDELLGGTPEEVPDAYREADVFPLVTGEIPFVAVQGLEDLQLTVEASRRVAARLKDVPNFEYVEIEDTDHFDPINPDSPACVDVVVPLVLTT